MESNAGSKKPCTNSLSQSYNEGLGKILGEKQYFILDFHVPQEYLDARRKSWDTLFDKYSVQVDNDTDLNLQTLQCVKPSEKDSDNSYLFPLPMRKAPSIIQYWINTGKLSYKAFLDDAQSDSGTSISEREWSNSIHSSAKCNVLCTNSTKQKYDVNSSCSSVDTAAYILSNTNVTKKAKSMALVEDAKHINVQPFAITPYKHSEVFSKKAIVQTSDQKTIVDVSNNNHHNSNSAIMGGVISKPKTNFTNHGITTTTILGNHELSKTKAVCEQDISATDINSVNVDGDNVGSGDCISIPELVSKDISPTLHKENNNDVCSTEVESTLSQAESSSADDIYSVQCRTILPDSTTQCVPRKKLYTGRDSPVDLLHMESHTVEKSNKTRRTLHPALDPILTVRQRMSLLKKRKVLMSKRKKRSSLFTKRDINSSQNSDINLSSCTESDSKNDGNSTIDSHDSSINLCYKEEVCNDMIKKLASPFLKKGNTINDLKNKKDAKEIMEGDCTESINTRSQNILNIEGKIKVHSTNDTKWKSVNLNPIVYVKRMSDVELQQYLTHDAFAKKDSVRMLKGAETQDQNTTTIQGINDINSTKNLKTRDSTKKSKNLLSCEMMNIDMDDIDSDHSTILICKCRDNRRNEHSCLSEASSSSDNSAKTILNFIENNSKDIYLQNSLQDELHSVTSNSNKTTPYFQPMPLDLTERINPVIVLQRSPTTKLNTHIFSSTKHRSSESVLHGIAEKNSSSKSKDNNESQIFERARNIGSIGSSSTVNKIPRTVQASSCSSSEFDSAPINDGRKIKVLDPRVLIEKLPEEILCKAANIDKYNPQHNTIITKQSSGTKYEKYNLRTNLKNDEDNVQSTVENKEFSKQRCIAYNTRNEELGTSKLTSTCPNDPCLQKQKKTSSRQRSLFFSSSDEEDGLVNLIRFSQAKKKIKLIPSASETEKRSTIWKSCDNSYDMDEDDSVHKYFSNSMQSRRKVKDLGENLNAEQLNSVRQRELRQNRNTLNDTSSSSVCFSSPLKISRKNRSRLAKQSAVKGYKNISSCNQKKCVNTSSNTNKGKLNNLMSPKWVTRTSTERDKKLNNSGSKRIGVSKNTNCMSANTKKRNYPRNSRRTYSCFRTRVFDSDSDSMASSSNHSKLSKSSETKNLEPLVILERVNTPDYNAFEDASESRHLKQCDTPSTETHSRKLLRSTLRRDKVYLSDEMRRDDKKRESTVEAERDNDLSSAKLPMVATPKLNIKMNNTLRKSNILSSAKEYTNTGKSGAKPKLACFFGNSDAEMEILERSKNISVKEHCGSVPLASTAIYNRNNSSEQSNSISDRRSEKQTNAENPVTKKLVFRTKLSYDTDSDNCSFL